MYSFGMDPEDMLTHKKGEHLIRLHPQIPYSFKQ